MAFSLFAIILVNIGGFKSVAWTDFLQGILMAIIGKKSTGMGTFVSTSLFASGIWCNAIGVVSHQPQFGGVDTE